MNIHVFYTGIIPLKLSKKNIKDSKAKGTCTCSFHFDQRSVTVSNFTTHKKA